MTRPRYLLEVEAQPSTNGTPTSRLRRLLKMMSRYRFKVRCVEEVRRDDPRPGRRRRRRGAGAVHGSA
jgi:hypothetical protein